MRDVEPTAGSLADLQAEADPESVARSVVLRRLAAAPRTRRELEDDLTRRGVPTDVIERVLDRFTEVGLIDDAEYARLWVDSRQRTRGSSGSVLRHELRRKGIPDEDAQAALAGIDAESERARAVELARVKLRTTSRLAPDVRLRRISSLLARRGYSMSVAMSVAREVVGAEAEPEESL